MSTNYLDNIKKLIELDLTEREAKVYISLLSKSTFTISELQQIVNIPRNKIYEVLNKMVTRGICIEHYIGKVKYYRAVEPEVAFNRVLNKFEKRFNEQIEAKKAIVKNLIEVFNPIFEDNKELVNPLDFIEILKDKNQIQKKYINSLQNTKNELLTFNKGPYVCDNSDRLNEQKEAETRLLMQDGSCRNIYEYDEVIRNNWLLQYIKDQSRIGQEARIIDSLPIKMMIFDSKIAMFPLQQMIGSSNKLTMIYIEHVELAGACKLLFNYLWEQAKTFDEISEELAVESFNHSINEHE
jgi:sugar-specific transcriptional regulator TrmB